MPEIKLMTSYMLGMCSISFAIFLVLESDFEKSDNIKSPLKHHFTCVSHGFVSNNEIIKLYLFATSLKIQCFFLAANSLPSEEFLYIFTSGGLAPSLTIINSTYTGIFHFNLTLFSDRVFWLIDIPRENITQNTDIAPVEEWLVRVSLQHGLDIFTTEGTLLDRIREPILQNSLGTVMTEDEISQVHPFIRGLKMTKSPCANDVALLGYILNDKHNGVYLGLTFSGFWDTQDITWHNLSENIYAIVGEEGLGLTLVDLVLTNRFLLILTSLGLFVSKDLRNPAQQSKGFAKIEFCGFERNDFLKGKLWYTERCLANKERFEADYVSITFDRNKTLSESSSCFYSKDPFVEWLPCLPRELQLKPPLPKVIAFLVDQDQRSGVSLVFRKVRTQSLAMVRIIKYNKLSLKYKFPVFNFPATFWNPTGLVFHPRSHFLYAYGNQIWLSMDGGNAFELLADLRSDVIKETSHSFYTSDVVFISQSGKIYRTKAGLRRYEKLGSVGENIFTLYYDHMGFIHMVTPTTFRATASHMNNILGQSPDMSFKTALAVQYITFSEVIFFAYVPLNEPPKTTLNKQFNKLHNGKAIYFRKMGLAYIKKILQHSTPVGFLSSAIADLIMPLGIEEAHESSCLYSSLIVTATSSIHYKLTLIQEDPKINSSFKMFDIEKTVVIRGYSSFLITRILDSKNALALATMPNRVLLNKRFRNDSWLLYNFGQSMSKRNWLIYPKPCNYWLQLFDDSQTLNDLKYIDLGQSQTLKIKSIPTVRGDDRIEIPQLKVIVGNPHMLQFESKSYFDEAESYILQVTVTSKAFRQGTVSMAFVMWDASTSCFVTTVIPNMKSSCGYLKSMHHVPYTHISKEDWNLGVHKDSQDFNLIKTLPVNYRPPSNMGIAIPLTDNFYHADPSKPIPRNLFPTSKKLGRFKQCENATNREDCNCTNDQKFSYAVDFSDCREKVPRFKFPVTNYPITLEIHSEDGHLPVTRPYLVTVSEVNQRGNWKLKHSVPSNIKKLKEYAEYLFQVPVYNPVGLNLSIQGSELFHFRVSVIEGVTFCQLVEEFQIYVDEVPMPFPGHTLIAIAAAVLLGGLIFIAFMLQIRNIHPWDMCNKLITKDKVQHSPFIPDNNF
ncbi:cation channel sperm-associated auxiliary subunit beta [Suncus etruscus]|uniref:cation channel sperm-associated auxiliary subunit beta n=1 Tax=Suncus etruscus TaxID=109475 RepID=UPI00210FF0EC|nr:cation channel sperm-associated auxiliary subunit beta [Suncus etruscus]